MELLEKYLLADGRECKIYRLITPAAEPVDENIIRYVIASLGFDYYRKFVNDQNYWRLYYRAAFDGEGAVDHFYFAEIDGVFAARMWFGYDPRTGLGNFGNVYTEPAFRKLGLMGKLLEPCVKDFYASEAVLLCCSTGSPHAAAAYRAGGFHMIYGGDTGPMCLINPRSGTHFSEVEKKSFDASPLQNIRCGSAGDQFPCDKFLSYCSALCNVPQGRGGADSFITDYRTAYQEYKNGNGVVCVAENGNGTVAGWAYAVKTFNCNCVNFAIHPDNAGELKKLLDFTLAEFRKMFPGESAVIYLLDRFQYQLQALQKSNFTPCAVIPGTPALTVFQL